MHETQCVLELFTWCDCDCDLFITRKDLLGFIVIVTITNFKENDLSTENLNEVQSSFLTKIFFSKF